MLTGSSSRVPSNFGGRNDLLQKRILPMFSQPGGLWASLDNISTALMAQNTHAVLMLLNRASFITEIAYPSSCVISV